MELETIKYLSTLGVGGVIAGFMFLIYRQDHQKVIKLEENCVQREAVLVQILQKNAVASEALTQTITVLMAQTQTSVIQQSNDMRMFIERLLDARQAPHH